MHIQRTDRPGRRHQLRQPAVRLPSAGLPVFRVLAANARVKTARVRVTLREQASFAVKQVIRDTRGLNPARLARVQCSEGAGFQVTPSPPRSFGGELAMPFGSVDARCPLCGISILSVGRGGCVLSEALHPVPLYTTGNSGYMLCDDCGMLAQLPAGLTLN